MLIYLISRKFHPSFGLVGKQYRPDLNPPDLDPICVNYILVNGVDDCEAAYRLQCRRGWEWYAKCKYSVLQSLTSAGYRR